MLTEDDDPPELGPRPAEEIHISELQRMSMRELLAMAAEADLEEYGGLKKQDLIFKILKDRTKLVRA